MTPTTPTTMTTTTTTMMTTADSIVRHHHHHRHHQPGPQRQSRCFPIPWRARLKRPPPRQRRHRASSFSASCPHARAPWPRGARGRGSWCGARARGAARPARGQASATGPTWIRPIWCSGTEHRPRPRLGSGPASLTLRCRQRRQRRQRHDCLQRPSAGRQRHHRGRRASFPGGAEVPAVGPR
jgi:hypothetical protein